MRLLPFLERSKAMKIKPAFTPVNIAFAANDGYAVPLSVTLYSMMKNASNARFYDILVMHKDISAENMEMLLKIAAHFPNCSLRFIDFGSEDSLVSGNMKAYYSSETNYRLFLFDEMFSEYDRMLYLDCDTVISGDISQLFDTDLKGNAAGAVPASEARFLSFSKRAVIFDRMPYNFDDYRRKVLCLAFPGRYFNAGVFLMDLTKCRELTSSEQAISLLNSKPFTYNDQDTLNIIFNKSICLLDWTWNYTVDLEQYNTCPDKRVTQLYEGTRRGTPNIIHYVSGIKPWNGEPPLKQLWTDTKAELDQLLAEGEN